MKKRSQLYSSAEMLPVAGFTLIELLVVIAIISILAAILFPVFASAREKARQTVCVSNEKQIGLAFLQYAQDYDEFLPCGTNSGSLSYTIGSGWMGQIYSYVNDLQVFHCPDDIGTPTGAAPLKGYIYPSYRYNCNLVSPNAARPYTMLLKPLGAFNAVSKTVLIAETSSSQLQVPYSVPALKVLETTSPAGNGYGLDSNGFGLPFGSKMVPRTAAQSVLPTTSRHSKGANWMCADGHVKWLLPSQVSFGYSAKALNTAGYFSGSGSLHAESTDYTGKGAHVFTMSAL